MAAVAAESIVGQAYGPESENSPFLLFYVLEDVFDARSTLGEEIDPRRWRILPADVLEKILLLLPARSQARFRIVCKAWLNLLTSEPFLTLTAALAFSREHCICAVSFNTEDYESARNLRSSRFKLHKVSLEWLPTKFRKFRRIQCQEGLILLTSSPEGGFRPTFHCVLNPTNHTFKALPDYFGERVSGYSVMGSGKGKFSIKVYVDGVYDYATDPADTPYGAVFDTQTDGYQEIEISYRSAQERPRARHREIGMVKDLIYFRYGWDDIRMYSSKNGDLVRRLPRWNNTEIIPQLSLCVMDNQVVALAFSSSEQHLCEVRQVNVSNTEWVLVSTMPYGVLWPHDDQLFYVVSDVQVVGNVAYLIFLGFDTPVYIRDEFRKWIQPGSYGTGGRRFCLPTHGFLVAYHLVRGVWKVVSDHWPFFNRVIMQPNPALSLA